jgi:YD repeat-containing protein
MSTRNIVPRNNGEGKLGTSAIQWGEGHFNSVLKRGGYQTAVEFLNIPSIYKRFSLTRDAGGKVTGVQYYDSNENIIGTAVITYDGSNNVTSVTDGVKTITFSYDADGNISEGSVA